jgi:hypothetical protein
VLTLAWPPSLPGLNTATIRTKALAKDVSVRKELLDSCGHVLGGLMDIIGPEDLETCAVDSSSVTAYMPEKGDPSKIASIPEGRHLHPIGLMQSRRAKRRTLDMTGSGRSWTMLDEKMGSVYQIRQA